MKIKIFYIALCFSLNSAAFAAIAESKTIDKQIELVFASLSIEIKETKAHYKLLKDPLQANLRAINRALATAVAVDLQVSLLLKKDNLKDTLTKISAKESADISKIRYLKGLQIIKLLYEKTLSLDHHFASVSTFRDINSMSNPNNYPEFTAVKEVLSNSKNRKTGFDLSSILGTNIYTSVFHSFISLFTNESTTRNEKEAKLQEVECILDFTLRMHGDLNTIYFETVFLQKSNETVILNLEQLFEDYTKPIQYTTSLEICRNNDDWDSVRINLNKYLDQLTTIIENDEDPDAALKMQINLEFPIDRLLQFITQYNAFIDQGGKFYEKFEIMLNSYENEQACTDKIPEEYRTLKQGIQIAIEKFHTAYKPVEINGSKMKEILYGINEYD